MIILYLVTCLCWAVFAMSMQKKLYPNSKLWRYLLVAIVHFVFCPICILWSAWLNL